MSSPSSSPAEEETFIARPALANGMSAAATSAGAGLLVSAIQNSLGEHKSGALGVFTRTGSTIATFTAMGGIFALADSAAANIREKDDAVNGLIGGCAAGLIIGARARSIPMMAGGCAGLGALIGTFDAAGKSLSGNYSRPTPYFGATAAEIIKDASSDEGPSEAIDRLASGGSFREEREQRRRNFFKQRKETESE